VVKPRISTFTWQRSSVRASTSAQIAAMEMGRPRMEPELSSSSVTTVSRNSVSFSTLKDSGVVGVRHHAGEPAGVEDAFLAVELPAPVLLRLQAGAGACWRAG
jgi:hypothetical protein